MIRSHIARACVVWLAAPMLASAGPLGLSYSVMGAGGLSAAQPGVSDAPFWWADTTGTMAASTVTSAGFDPFPAFTTVVDSLGAGGGGSLLMSSAFTLGEDSTLQVSFELLKVFFSYSNSDLTAPLGFALLVSEDRAPVVLANVTAENRTYFNNGAFLTTVPVSDTPFTPTSPGVTMTGTMGSGRDVTLNGTHYSTVPDTFGFCGCYLDVTSTLTPGAGTYRLLFGVYDFIAGGTSSHPDMFNGALAVTNVQATPEPSTLMLIGTGLAMGGFARRRRGRRRTS